MTIAEQDQDALRRCCNNNQEAIDFLQLWSDYVNLIDDIVDEDLVALREPGRVVSRGSFERAADRVCEMGARAIALYSHPFYLKHIAALRQIALNCTNAYADVVQYEISDKHWQREWADHYRHFGSEMVMAVAYLCGGGKAWGHMRAVSAAVRVICYQSHHNEEGEVV